MRHFDWVTVRSQHHDYLTTGCTPQLQVDAGPLYVCPTAISSGLFKKFWTWRTCLFNGIVQIGLLIPSDCVALLQSDGRKNGPWEIILLQV